MHIELTHAWLVLYKSSWPKGGQSESLKLSEPNGQTELGYLGGGAALAAGADQVRGIGQIDEELLLGLKAWRRQIQQENLRR